jgi:hypothetical protein
MSQAFFDWQKRIVKASADLRNCFMREVFDTKESYLGRSLTQTNFFTFSDARAPTPLLQRQRTISPQSPVATKKRQSGNDDVGARPSRPH